MLFFNGFHPDVINGIATNSKLRKCHELEKMTESCLAGFQ
jgi:hypothetical protein